MKQRKIRNQAIHLRKEGKTFTEICSILNEQLPKATLNYWFKDVVLPKESKERLEQIRSVHLTHARQMALKVKRASHQQHLANFKANNLYLASFLENGDIAKITLATLYLCEGRKTNSGSVMFGNSDPNIIRFYLQLFRQCYQVNEQKFRCTVQCRADQNVSVLETFWSNITCVPSCQFYKAQIDPRTIGKPSKKPNYQGVCRESIPIVE